MFPSPQAASAPSPLVDTDTSLNCIAFAGPHRLAAGPLWAVALAVHAAEQQGTSETLLVFDAETSRLVDLDLRGTTSQLQQRYPLPNDAAPLDADTAATEPERRLGRPKLGVIAREVTLLPRHWDWLQGQQGGASVALRKLVDQARRTQHAADQRRLAQDAAYRFMSAMAGDYKDFEEAARALFADQPQRLQSLTAQWPADVRDHVLLLADRVFAGTGPDSAPAQALV